MTKDSSVFDIRDCSGYAACAAHAPVAGHRLVSVVPRKRPLSAHSRARIPPQRLAHSGDAVTRGAARGGDGAARAAVQVRAVESAAPDVVRRDLECVLYGKQCAVLRRELIEQGACRRQDRRFVCLSNNVTTILFGRDGKRHFFLKSTP